MTRKRRSHDRILIYRITWSIACGDGVKRKDVSRKNRRGRVGSESEWSSSLLISLSSFFSSTLLLCITLHYLNAWIRLLFHSLLLFYFTWQGIFLETRVNIFQCVDTQLAPSWKYEHRRYFVIFEKQGFVWEKAVVKYFRKDRLTSLKGAMSAGEHACWGCGFYSR